MMSDSRQENQKAVDPLEPWREMRDAYMKVWAKAMGETVNSEEYAKSSGAVLETYLTASAPFRDAQKKIMVSALEQMNMPSRADFISLAERMTNVELLLDDMDAKLSQIFQFVTKAASQDAFKVETPAVKTQPVAAKPQRPAASAASKSVAETVGIKSVPPAKAATKEVNNVH
jgi:polyhydroxyalkanoic acid synthase PhaR subunit